MKIRPIRALIAKVGGRSGLQLIGAVTTPAEAQDIHDNHLEKKALHRGDFTLIRVEA